MTRKHGPRIGMSPFYRDYLKAKARNKTTPKTTDTAPCGTTPAARKGNGSEKNTRLRGRAARGQASKPTPT